jgi:hypothetical protein
LMCFCNVFMVYLIIVSDVFLPPYDSRGKVKGGRRLKN